MSITAVFIGLPGSGKTTVGRMTASSLGVPFADSDTLIEAEAGLSIPEIFAERGEEGFRELESKVIAQALEEGEGILSLGGGAVLHERTRTALRGHRVFWIDLSDNVLAARLDRSTVDRPLLREGDTRARIASLRKQREAYYRECATDILHSDGTPARRVARQAQALLGHEAPYIANGGDFDILIGTGLATHAALALDRVSESLCVYDGEPQGEYASLTSRKLHLEGSTSERLTRLREEVGQLPRASAILALGSRDLIRLVRYVGATTDGGIPVACIPTTLGGALCGVFDARIPGTRTRIGASPADVLLDTDVLTVEAEGLAEVLSLGFSAHPELITMATRPIASWDAESLGELLRVAVHARLGGAIVNQRGEEFAYGHSFARAISAVNPELSHGQCVGLGMLCAAGIAEALTIGREGLTEEHRLALQALGLPTTVRGIAREQLLDTLERQAALAAPDSKMAGRGNRFLIIEEPGTARIVHSVTGHALGAGMRAIGA